MARQCCCSGRRASEPPTTAALQHPLVGLLFMFGAMVLETALFVIRTTGERSAGAGLQSSLGGDLLAGRHVSLPSTCQLGAVSMLRPLLVHCSAAQDALGGSQAGTGCPGKRVGGQAAARAAAWYAGSGGEQRRNRRGGQQQQRNNTGACAPKRCRAEKNRLTGTTPSVADTSSPASGVK